MPKDIRERGMETAKKSQRAETLWLAHSCQKLSTYDENKSSRVRGVGTYGNKSGKEEHY
jgi:hypothetical protein